MLIVGGFKMFEVYEVVEKIMCDVVVSNIKSFLKCFGFESVVFFVECLFIGVEIQ